MLPSFKKTPIVLALTILVPACAEPPKSPMEKHARLAAAAAFVATNCAGYAGGYESARSLRKDADKNIQIARNLGATDGVLKKARQDVETTFITASAFTSHQEACNSLVGSVAWHA